MPNPEGLRFNPNVLSTQPSAIRAIYQFAPKNIPLISLGLGELSYDPPQAVRDAMHAAIEQKGANKYTPNNGIPELRAAIAQDIGRRHGVERGIDDVIVTVGSTEALFAALYTFLAEGNSVVLPEIGYTAYQGDAGMMGHRTFLYKLREDFEPDIGNIVDQLDDSPGTKLVILNSPSNPNGHVTRQETVEELAERTKNRNDVVFLSDDIYEDFVYDNRNTVSIARYLADKTITISGLSKSASITGYRLGWMSGPSRIIQEASKAHMFMVSSADSIVQRGAIPVVRGECVSEVTAFKVDLQRKRDLMVDQLRQIPNISTVNPEGAFYCFIEVGNYGNSMNVSRRIIEETGVVTTPGIAFGDAADKFIRLSYAVDDKAIIDGTKKIKGVFESW